MLSRRALLAGGLLGALGMLISRFANYGTFARSPGLVELTTGGQAAECWFQEPRVLRAAGKVYFGGLDNAGNVECRAIDEVTGNVSAAAATYPSFQNDDHDNPTFLILPDGRVVAFFSGHVGDAYICKAPTADVAGLVLANTVNITNEIGGRSGTAGYTYLSSSQLLDEAGDPIYLSFRYHNAPSGALAFAAMSRSYDEGVSWEDLDGNPNAHSLLALVTYHKHAKNGEDRIDFAFSNHPDDPLDHGVYHGYYQAGDLYKTDGTLIGAVGAGGEVGGAYALSDFTQVFDDAAGIAWIWDLAIDRDNGDVVITYVVYEPTYPGGRWHYEYARSSGGAAFDTNEVADAGSKFPTTSNMALGGQYAGGINIDRFDTTKVMYSTNAGGGNHRVFESVTPDGGATWPSPVARTDGSDKAVRVMPVHGEPGPTAWIVEHGSYDDYQGNYAMDFAAWR